MSNVILTIDAAVKCNASCERGVISLVRLIVRFTWGYLHYWTLAIIGPIVTAYGYLRWRSR